MAVVVSWLLISADINAGGMITHPNSSDARFCFSIQPGPLIIPAKQSRKREGHTALSFSLAPPCGIVSNSAARSETYVSEQHVVRHSNRISRNCSGGRA